MRLHTVWLHSRDLLPFFDVRRGNPRNEEWIGILAIKIGRLVINLKRTK